MVDFFSVFVGDIISVMDRLLSIVTDTRSCIIADKNYTLLAGILVSCMQFD